MWLKGSCLAATRAACLAAAASAKAFCLFCRAVTFSLMCWRAEATDGGSGMFAGLRGSWICCWTWPWWPLMFSSSFGTGWLGRWTVFGDVTTCCCCCCCWCCCCCCCWCCCCCCWCCCGCCTIIVFVMMLLLLLLLLFMMMPLVLVLVVGEPDTTSDVPGMGSDWPEWLCDAWCFLSSRLSRYPREQTAQTNGFSPVWIRTWVT